MAKAEFHEKKIVGLETVEEQMGFFEQMDESMQVEMIMSVVRDTVPVKKNWAEMQAKYLSQSLNSLEEAVEEGSMSSFMTKTLLDNRNSSWLIKLDPILREKPTFVAVGAAHLIGEKGILIGLKELGYRIEPVTISMYK